ncbi:MAG: type II toxin-antitoxin system RelE/ParE family toxin [Roseiarcus sp.]
MTDKAEADLAEIWAYVAVEVSEAAATRLVDKLYAACEPLRQFPRLGPAREQFAAGLRVCFSGNYALYYLHDDDAVTIVRVLHGSRDVAALAQPGGLTGGA